MDEITLKTTASTFPPRQPRPAAAWVLPLGVLCLAYGLLGLTLTGSLSHQEIMQRCVLVDPSRSRLWSVGNVEVGMAYLGVFSGMIFYFLQARPRHRQHIHDFTLALAYLIGSFTLDYFCVLVFHPFTALLIGDAVVITFTALVSRHIWFQRLLGVFVPLVFLTCGVGHFLEGLSYWKLTYPVNVPWTMVTADIGFAILLNGSRFPAFIRGEDVVEDLAEERARTGALQAQIEVTRQTQEALAKSQERLVLALESGRLGTYHTDTTTNSFLEISETLKRQLGFAPHEEVTPADVVQRRHPEDRDKVTGVIQTAQDSHRYLESESRYVWPDGSIHWIASNGRPVYSETGEAIGLIGVTQDITERKEAEEKIQELNQTLERRVAERTAQLEAANRELEAFSYSVSHDLRAPLRSIDGFSQALLEDYSDRLDKTGQDFLKRVRAASQRMSVLIDDLLSLSRVTRSEMQRQQVNLSALAGTLKEELGAAHPERSVETSITPELWADADPRLLRVVMENLLGNAWKYTAKCPTARIEIGQTEYAGKLCFFVRDNGAGFDMDSAAKLFTPFQRMHTQQEFEGTGIGLATVQRILHRHGGRIWAEAAVDQGATFYFTV